MSGQASVEAAILLPVLFIIVAVMVEPACLMYSQSVINSTAAETARAAATYTDNAALEQFALRRLEAIPEVSIFHVGGSSDWQIEITRSERGASVHISGHARPLPLLGVLSSAFTKSDTEGIVLEATVYEQLYPDWVGGGYSEWQSIWG